MRYFLSVIVLCTLISNLFPAPMHAVHISYGEAILKDNSFTGKITINKADFMTALRNFRGKSLSGLTDREFDKLKFDYLSKHLTVTSMELKPAFRITGSSEDDNSIWFCFSFIFNEPVKFLSIHNDILMNEFSDQMNLLTIKKSNSEESKIFSSSSPETKVRI